MFDLSTMPEHDLALFTLGLILLCILAAMIALGMLQDRWHEQEFERAYQQSRENKARLAGLLGESEAAAILREHDRRMNEPATLA